MFDFFAASQVPAGKIHVGFCSWHRSHTSDIEQTGRMSARADTALYLRFAPTKPPYGVLAADAVTIPSAGSGKGDGAPQPYPGRPDLCNPGFA